MTTQFIQNSFSHFKTLSNTYLTASHVELEMVFSNFGNLKESVCKVSGALFSLAEPASEMSESFEL